jgi:NNP family nitrate/nitrite transporter-like MFS transporter
MKEKRPAASKALDQRGSRDEIVGEHIVGNHSESVGAGRIPKTKQARNDISGVSGRIRLDRGLRSVGARFLHSGERQEASMLETVAPKSTWIDRWEPEDDAFWEGGGRRVARRNLIWSIVAENLGFSVWLIWSVTATKLPKVGFHYSTEQLFNLVALPGLIGSLMRFPYAFAVPRFGGRNWTIVSALLLFVPTLSLAFLVSRPATPYWVMALAAATAGLGGGNFASSMANISFFYPDREKGFALGLNAAGGNIGVSTVQLLVPIVIGWSWLNLGVLPPSGGMYLENAGVMWLPFIALAVYGATRHMNNLSSARSSVKDQLVIARRKHTWIMSWLYIGTFGSFIGYSAAFPLLLKTQFPEHPANLAFLGPLVGSLARPVGGRFSDVIGGTKVTFWNFLAMALATVGVIHFVDAHEFGGFVIMFLALFVTTGVGNGSTYRMIPVIFRNEKLARLQGRETETREAALKAARIEGAAVLGFVAAVGACGGYLIPRGFAASLHATGSAHLALVVFLAFYASCIGITWTCYMRRKVTAIGVAQLEAQI